MQPPPPQSLVSLIKGPGKRQSRKTGNCDNNCSTPSDTTENNCDSNSIHTSKG